LAFRSSRFFSIGNNYLKANISSFFVFKKKVRTEVVYLKILDIYDTIALLIFNFLK
jgi:hypothetical protein